MVIFFVPKANAQTPMGATVIQHVVFILKENHTFDNYFGGFPGVDGVAKGKTHNGRLAVLRRPPEMIPRDIAHTNLAALVGIDHGKMDRFDLLSGAFQESRLMNYTQYQPDQIPNYWALASRFVIGDEFFSSEHGPSFPNHLFTIAAQAGGAIDNPDEGGRWGCDSDQFTTVPIIDPKGGRHELPPCFDFPTVADSINTAGLNWRYYGALEGGPGYIWSAFDAIQHIRMGPQWQTNVLADSQFAGDVAAGTLANVTWITTEAGHSEHPAEGDTCNGENETIALVNAIMNSSFWNSTAIFISWDDFGGLYDHVAPPQLDAWGLGPRVPLLIVSPYSKSGYIEHQQLEFSSVVKFMEELFQLPFLTARDTNSNDMFDAFDFTQNPLPPMPLTLRKCR
jgi:phospholipase C